MPPAATNPPRTRLVSIRRLRVSRGLDGLISAAARTDGQESFAQALADALSGACGGCAVELFGADAQAPVVLAQAGPAVNGPRPGLTALLRGAVQPPPRVIPLRLGGVTVGYAVLHVNPLPHGSGLRQLINVGALGLARWQANAQAHAERTERDRLIHDFKSPAASIELAASELLYDPALGEANRELIDLIAKQARTLQDRALRLLSARGASGRCNLAQAAEEVVAAARPAARAQSRELHLLCLDRPLVRADAVEATRAIENLVMNALHHTPPRTTVQVVVAVDQGSAVCEVRDAGPGLSQVALDALLRDGGRGATSRGHGLGLGIAQAVADAAGGSLSLASAPGEGASFTLRLPLGQDRRGG